MRKSVWRRRLQPFSRLPPAQRPTGPMWDWRAASTLPRRTRIDVTVNNGTTSTTYNDGYKSKTRSATTSTLILGYQLGLLRLEGEAGYQRAKVKSLGVSSTPLITDVGTAAGTTVTADDLSVGNHIGLSSPDGQCACSTAISAAASAATPAAAPAARGRSSRATSDNAWAYPGHRRPALCADPEPRCGREISRISTPASWTSPMRSRRTTAISLRTRAGNSTSNNVLASLVYNFNSREAAAPIPAAAPAPPPPPPPAPATQTCPDGSVIQATATCPAPPPPPPPPPPAQRGERGLSIDDKGKSLAREQLASRESPSPGRPFFSGTSRSCWSGSSASDAGPCPSGSRSPRC